MVLINNVPITRSAAGISAECFHCCICYISNIYETYIIIPRYK